MGIGALTWTCLLWAAPAAPPEAWPINDRTFQIPIAIKPDRRADVRKVYLYVSRDLGHSWGKQMTAAAEQEAFRYTAPADGTYWFAVTTLNSQGKEDPEDVYAIKKVQKVLVDTAPPKVGVAAERRGEDVVVRWQVQDDNPDPGLVQVEYRPADSPESGWITVNVPAGGDQASFHPDRAGDYVIRVRARDVAGNMGEGTAPVGQPGTSTGGVQTASGFFDASGAQVRKQDGGPPTRVPPPSPGAPPGPGALELGFPPAPSGTGSLTPPSAPSGPSGGPAPAGPPSAAPPPVGPPSGGFPDTVGGAPTRPAVAPPPSVGGSVLHSTEASPLNGVTRGSLTPVKIVNKRQVRIEFDISKVGPSGVGSVEVYVTHDEGATWQLSAADSKPSLPPEAQSGPTRASVMLNLDHEGAVIGYCLIVKSRAGLGRQPPTPGEPPQFRLELDLSKPVVALYAPQPDRDHANTLLLYWKAWDRNPADRPIMIEWSEHPSGPWKPICEEAQPNNQPIGPVQRPEQLKELGFTGNYAWHLPDQMPPKVYLRLTVRDKVGNTAIAQTPQPVLIDLSVPEVGNVVVDP